MMQVNNEKEEHLMCVICEFEDSYIYEIFVVSLNYRLLSLVLFPRRLSPIYGCDILGAIWVMGMLSSCIFSTLVSVCAMKGIPIGHWLSEERNWHTTSLLSLRYVLPSWCMSREGPASGQNTLHTYICSTIKFLSNYAQRCFI